MPSFSFRSFSLDLRSGRHSSALARRLLALVYRENRVYSVPFGPLRGMKLRYDRTVNNQVMLGFSDSATFGIVLKVLASEASESNWVVCDVGANIGTYSLFFARYLPQGVVYAFEPVPSTAHRLRDNLGLNQIRTVSVFEQACSDCEGQVEFFVGQHHTTSSLHSERAGGGQKPQALLVETITLDSFFYGPLHRPGPNFIKMDIEGGGTFALKGCIRCIQEMRPLFLIESHTPDEDRAISDLILSYNYHAFSLNRNCWVVAPDQVHPHPDGVWGTLLLWPTERLNKGTRVLGS